MPCDQLLVALDVDTVDEARALANKLRHWAGGFKIGSRLFTAHGPGLVQELVKRGDRVFLDLKFHDIPNTVAGAVGAAARAGVWMVNVHAAGGLEMMKAARAAADEEAANVDMAPPYVIAVTVLTSLDQPMLARTGVNRAVVDHAVELASLAQEAALDGVVASPHEISAIRERCGERFLVVTPGIRGSADLKGDQVRTTSAAGALEAGASFIVVGRPIIAAPDPAAAAERIAEECKAVRR
jgi:orotidine-5'-phosphate decarboxylase